MLQSAQMPNYEGNLFLYHFVGKTFQFTPTNMSCRQAVGHSFGICLSEFWSSLFSIWRDLYGQQLWRPNNLGKVIISSQFKICDLQTCTVPQHHRHFIFCINITQDHSCVWYPNICQVPTPPHRSRRRSILTRMMTKISIYCWYSQLLTPNKLISKLILLQ